MFVILSFNYKLKSQTWTQIAPVTGQSLWGLELISESKAWAVWDLGTIIFTSNGGLNWSSQSSGTTSYFNSVNFINENIGWVAGENSTIYKTTNGGLNWIYQSTGYTQSIGGISAYNNQHLWAGGLSSEIIYSSNGGTSWVLQTTPTAQDIWDIKAITQNTVYACGNNGVIYKTTDGGNTWNQQTSGTSSLLWSIDFFDENFGYACGDDGTILKTTNGGVNWSTQSSGFVGSLYDIFISNQNIAFCVGVTGKILKTTNGGASWFDVPSGTSEALTRIRFFGETGIVSGQSGLILKYNLFLPTLGLTSVSNISFDSFNATSSVTSDGNVVVSERGFVWSKSQNPTILSNSGKINLGSGIGEFSSQINGLTPNSIYYIRAFATNSEGTKYSNQIQVVTTGDFTLPNNGDGNGDGIQDSLQNNVKTLLSSNNNGYITIEELNGFTLYDVFTKESSDNKNDIYYPFGLLEFKVNSAISKVKIYYHNTSFLTKANYKKLRNNGIYFNFHNYEIGSELINGNRVATIILTLTDGGIGDFDNSVNGVIYDPGGPVLPVSANVPFWDYWWTLILIPIFIYSYKRFGWKVLNFGFIFYPNFWYINWK